MTTVQRIKYLAKQQGRSISYICKQLGFTARTYFNDIEKTGREIPADKLEIIAEILNTSVDYLLGNTDEIKKESDKKSDTRMKNIFTPHELNVMVAYRAHPELQPAVDRLLGIEQDGQIYVYTAAHSEDKRLDKIIRMDKETWEKIKNAPDTDDTLL